jgi:hypothetical protein
MAEEFVQSIKLKVDDSELVAAVKRFREAFGGGVAGVGGNNPASGLEKGMQKASKAASEAARQAKNISSGMKEATRETNGLTSAFNSMKGAVTGLVAAYAGFKGISALVGFGRGSIDAFNVQNRAERMLEFGMRQNGTQARSRELKEFASLLQKNTLYGDEALLTAAAGWQNKIHGVENSKRMMALVADYAAKSTGGGTVDAGTMRGFSQQLMQALTGRAITLKAQGLDISAIERLNEIRRKGGTVTEDMEIEALEKVLAPIRGMAQEIAKTDEGKIQQLKNDIGDMREEIGRELLPVVGEIAKSMKENLPTLKKVFEGFKDVLVSLMDTVKAHTGEIREFASAFSDALKLFSQAPVEIMGFVAAMKLLGPAMRAARASALDSGTGFVLLGKTLKSIGKGGLVAGAIWGLEQIYKAAKTTMELASEKSREGGRTNYKANFDEAHRHVQSQIDFQKSIGLSEKEKSEVLARMNGVGNIDLQNVRNPAVGRLYSGLNENQISWMKHEFEKRKYMAQRQAAMNAMNKVGQLPKPDISTEDELEKLEKQLKAENAKLTKGDTYNNNITVYNSISADSEMTAKIIKEQLRFFATSQLNFTSRTAAAKAFAL